MGDSRNSLGGGLIILLLVVAAVLYYGFHMVQFGWVLKVAFAIVVLFVAGVCFGTGYLIASASKKRKEKQAEKARKNLAAAQEKAKRDAEEAERKARESVENIRNGRE